MRRREFIAALAGTAAWPLAVGAQQSSPPLIGFVSARSPEDSANVLQAFYKGLKEEGAYVDGQSAKVEHRWARGNCELLPVLARELVEHGVGLLVAVGGDASARAAKSATSEIPIVFTMSGDPVEAGLVQSINRPGGNATGCIVVTTGELDAKRLDLLREIVPDTSAFGVLVNPKYPPSLNQALALERAAAKISRAIFIVNASTDAELDAALATLSQKRIGGFVVAQIRSSIHGVHASLHLPQKIASPASISSANMRLTADSSVTGLASPRLIGRSAYTQRAFSRVRSRPICPLPNQQNMIWSSISTPPRLST
jgi:putative tryptophan/tyrosine transport system substrate-binding protein